MHRRRPTGLGLGLALAGCVGAPPPPPASHGTDGTSPGDPTHGDAEPTQGPEVDTTATAASTGPTTTTPPPDTTGTGAQLIISDGPVYGFGDVLLGMPGFASLTVTNIGDTDATGMIGLPLTAPFAYTAGAYPGAGGTCTDSLAAGASCTVALSFLPLDIGLHLDILAIAYEQGTPAIRELVGGGAGQGPNLLLNPGGEDEGSPPPGWTNPGPGEWVAGVLPNVDPYEGVGYHYAADGPPLSDFALIQLVDVSPWSATIDRGMMHFGFVGWGRTRAVLTSQYRLVVRVQDDDGEELDSWTSGWETNTAWQMHETEGFVPAGTRRVEVELGCTKFGSDPCDALFDGLDLRAAYP